jgi:translocator protein
MVPAWLVIGLVAVGIGVGLNQLIKSDQRWFFRLRRPAWLTFESLIPLIWTVIFVAVAWSAYNVWQTEPGTGRTWGLMAGYAILELVTLAYTPVMCAVRKLKVGVMIGALGFVICAGLAIGVSIVSSVALGLLVPYLLWSPIGTFVTWQMMALNPGDA